MAAVTKVRSTATTLKTVQQVTLRDVDGTERNLQFIKARDSTNVLRVVFQEPGSPPTGGSVALTVTPSPASRNFNQSLGGPSGVTQNFTGTCSVAVTGGTPPYTYAWSYDHGDTTITCAPTNAAAATFNGSIPGTPTSIETWWNCLVTDASGLFVSTQFGVGFSLGVY